MSDLFINKNEWKHFTPSEMGDYVERVFNHYRAAGFPYFPDDDHTRQEQFRKLMQFDISNLIDGKVINQTMHGLALAWSYMPHSWDVVCNNKRTPIQAFNDDGIFRQVIRKRIKMGDNISDNGIRKMLKLFSGNQSVSNFRPTAAAAIYKAFTNPGDTVLDMSAGYGGRLLGAIKADVNYIGYEPCGNTYEGLNQIADDFCQRGYRLYHTGSEMMDLSNAVDFAFTSPPYFNTEKYSTEATQSYIKFPTKTLWVDGYLRSTFLRTHRALRDRKFMAINIQDVPSFKNLCSVAISVAQESGFTLTGSLKLALSNPSMSTDAPAFKYEPVFIFQKD